MKPIFKLKKLEVKHEPPATPPNGLPTRKTPESPSKKKVKKESHFPIDFEAIRAITRAYNRQLPMKTATTKTKKYLELTVSSNTSAKKAPAKKTKNYC